MIAASEEKRARYRASGWWGDTTLGEMFLANAQTHPDRLALIDPPNRGSFAFGVPQRLTYAELRAEIVRVAAVLVEQGLKKDDVLLAQLPNISELVILYFACSLIGVVISPTAVQYRGYELASMVETIRPRAFVCATQMKGCDHVGVAQQVLGDDTLLMTFGPCTPVGALDLSCQTADPVALAAYREGLTVDADDIFTICWTSGTTGKPKGVPRSHNHWAAISCGTYQLAKLRDGDVLLNPFPMINMASIGGVTMSWLRVAGTMVLHHPFDAGIFLAQIAQERPGFTIAPPAILNMLLLDEELLARADLSSLRSIGSGSAPLASAMVRGFQERLGIMVINLFGSNEGMSLQSGPDMVPDPDERARYFLRQDHYVPFYGTQLQAQNEMRLIPPGGEDEITEEGIAGELQVRGPTLFEGYYNTPETTSSFTEDGFFRTGDLFEIANGGRFLMFVGRCKDLIIRGGMNIAPEEIDQLLGGHPKLAEACTFSLPDEVMGERIGLAVVPRPGETVELADVTEFLKKLNLAKFKFPERLFLFDGLPRNVTNKVMRHEVRDRAIAMQQEGT